MSVNSTDMTSYTKQLRDVHGTIRDEIGHTISHLTESRPVEGEDESQHSSVMGSLESLLSDSIAALLRPAVSPSDSAQAEGDEANEKIVPVQLNAKQLANQIHSNDENIPQALRAILAAFRGTEEDDAGAQYNAVASIVEIISDFAVSNVTDLIEDETPDICKKACEAAYRTVQSTLMKANAGTSKFDTIITAMEANVSTSTKVVLAQQRADNQQVITEAYSRQMKPYVESVVNYNKIHKRTTKSQGQLDKSDDLTHGDTAKLSDRDRLEKYKEITNYTTQEANARKEQATIISNAMIYRSDFQPIGGDGQPDHITTSMQSQECSTASLSILNKVVYNIVYGCNNIYMLKCIINRMMQEYDPETRLVWYPAQFVEGIDPEIGNETHWTAGDAQKLNDAMREESSILATHIKDLVDGGYINTLMHNGITVTDHVTGKETHIKVGVSDGLRQIWAILMKLGVPGSDFIRDLKSQLEEPNVNPNSFSSGNIYHTIRELTPLVLTAINQDTIIKWELTGERLLSAIRSRDQACRHWLDISNKYDSTKIKESDATAKFYDLMQEILGSELEVTAKARQINSCIMDGESYWKVHTMPMRTNMDGSKRMIHMDLQAHNASANSQYFPQPHDGQEDGHQPNHHMAYSFAAHPVRAGFEKCGCGECADMQKPVDPVTGNTVQGHFYWHHNQGRHSFYYTDPEERHRAFPPKGQGVKRPRPNGGPNTQAHDSYPNTGYKGGRGSYHNPSYTGGTLNPYPSQKGGKGQGKSKGAKSGPKGGKGKGKGKGKSAKGKQSSPHGMCRAKGCYAAAQGYKMDPISPQLCGNHHSEYRTMGRETYEDKSGKVATVAFADPRDMSTELDEPDPSIYDDPEDWGDCQEWDQNSFCHTNVFEEEQYEQEQDQAVYYDAEQNLDY